MTSVTDPQNETATYTYDSAGDLSIFSHFNGIITTYTYDMANRLLGAGSIVSNYQFTLDENGNWMHSSDTEPVAATPAEAAISYGYNTLGNRLLSAGPLTYTYDNEGQLANASGTAYSFDYNHRLTGIGSDTLFSYDGRGHRLSAVRAGVATHYIYDPWGNLIATADASNNITTKFIYGRGLLAMSTSAGRYCYHFNGTGSTAAVTDMNQNIVNSYAFDPFGQILAQQETIPQPFKFVGQYGVVAEPNGLYYMRARYYDPTVGRFISEDPLGFGGGDVNLYAYVRNNAVNRVDPNGLLGWDTLIQNIITYPIKNWLNKEINDDPDRLDQGGVDELEWNLDQALSQFDTCLDSCLSPNNTCNSGSCINDCVNSYNNYIGSLKNWEEWDKIGN
jgi:RHS repeat-associated protein